MRHTTAQRLRDEVVAMNIDNFIVRPKRRWVEQFAESAAWERLGTEERQLLTDEVAGLPSALVDDDIEAKQFDLLMLRLQLAVLRLEPSFAGLRDKVRHVAASLEDKASIPMIKAQLPLLQGLQTDAFWQDVTTPILEDVRRRLRALIRLIEKSRRQPVYSDFLDSLGVGTEIQLPVFDIGTDLDKFRAKVRLFLKAHEDLIAVQKLRRNKPLTAADLEALEGVLIASGVGTPGEFEQAKQASQGLGLFVRSLIGLESQAVADTFNAFQAGKTLTANQLEFIQLITAHLTQNGVMDPGLLYESPYTDLDPLGVEGIFGQAEVIDLLAVLDDVRRRALVS
ncbi:MAG: hypothetical protein H7338_24085 [Candidatus Sericytochromatia bacterium]|nr:hypothetical protein [Candidatus Sericytochromatia bacterium]